VGRGWRAAACALLVVALAAGCAVREPRPDGAWLSEREALFAAYPIWSVNGRVGLSDGRRGGSLAFDWSADGPIHEVRLRTVTGGRQWRLRFGPMQATLEGSDVGLLRGPDPEPLVEAAVGWPIPVSELAWWIRGIVPPGRETAIRFAADGTLASASSPPWEIAFERFDDWSGELMPARIDARSADYRVRLVLRGWHLGSRQEASPSSNSL